MTLENKLKNALKSNDINKIHAVFDEIYTMYGRLVYFKISQYVDNKLLVEEFSQDVFVSFYNNIMNCEITNIKYYLVTAAKNKGIDYLNKKKVEVIFDEKAIFEKEDYSSNIGYNEIIEKMKLFLTEFEIEIIIKHVVDGYSFKQLSSMYNKPLNTIFSIYSRSLKKFKKGSDYNERK